MKIATTLLLFVFTSKLLATAHISEVKIGTGEYSFVEELKISFKHIVSDPFTPSPIMVIHFLTETDENELYHYSYFVLNPSDTDEVVAHDRIVGKLKAEGLYSGTNSTNMLLNFNTNIYDILKEASKHTVEVKREELRDVRIDGRISYEGRPKAFFAAIIYKGKVIATYDKPDHRFLLTNNLERDWYIYGKYPRKLKYTNSRSNYPSRILDK